MGRRGGTALLVTLGAFLAQSLPAIAAGTAVRADAAVGPGIAVAADIAVPADIDATGGDDVTEPLRRFIAGVPDGSTIVFPPGARYRIEGVVLIEDRADLVFEGNGVEFFATTDGSGVQPPNEWYGRHWPRHRAHWVIASSHNIVLRDMVVRGANPHGGPTNRAFRGDLEAQHGFELYASRDVTIEGCTISDTYGDGVSITWESRDVTVRDCTIENVGRQGIGVDNATDVLIEGNVVRDIGRSAFDLEPSAASWAVRDVRIVDNIIGRANGIFVAAAGAGSGLSDVEIVGNRLHDEPLMVVVKAPEGHRRQDVSVVDNRSDKRFGSPVAPLRFTRVDGVVVRGNHQEITRTQSRLAVFVEASCDVVITDNEFPGAIGHDIDIGERCAARDTAPVDDGSSDDAAQAPAERAAPAAEEPQDTAPMAALFVALAVAALVGLLVALRLRRDRSGRGYGGQ